MDETVISAPGKVILHGEHAVVYGKTAVASSLNLRCFLKAASCQDGSVILDLPDVQILRQWTVETLQRDLQPKLVQDNNHGPEPASKNDLEILRQFAGIQGENATTAELAVIAFLYLFCKIGCSSSNRTLPALHLRMISELPVGAGLGSSAAFSVCLAAVLLQWSGCIQPCNSSQAVKSEPRDGGMGDVPAEQPGKWTHNELLLINKWAFLGEKIIHGQPSGIDNSVSTLGGAICFQNKNIKPVEKMPRLRILLSNTKVPRSTKVLVEGVRYRHEKHMHVMEHILDAIENIALKSMDIFSAISEKPGGINAYMELEELIEINQSLLNALGVGHPALDRIVTLTAKYHLHTKLTGAGGGGCAYTLIRPDANEDDVRNVIKELEGEGFQCWETRVGDTGVRFHPFPQSDPTIPHQLFASL